MEFHAVKIGVVRLFPNAKEFQCVSAAHPVPRADLTRRGAARRVRGMKPVPTLYLDTSVIGGYFDEDWQRIPTRELWRQMELGCFRFVTSAVTREELDDGAPQEIRDFYGHTFADSEMVFDITDEMEDLAEAYIRAGIVSEKYTGDALHVAACAIARADFLVSWNFTHLVNVRRRDAFNGVNLLQGYPPVHIVSPKELLYENDDK